MKKLWMLSVAVLMFSASVMAEVPPTDASTPVHTQPTTAATQPVSASQYPADQNAADQAEVASLIQKANACILERESKNTRR